MDAERSPAKTARPRSPLFWLGAFYFFNYGALGALFPFLPLLLSSRGLTPFQISWVMLLVPLFTLLMPPLWGALADAIHARVTLLRLASLGSALSVLLLLPRWGFGGHLFTLGLFSFFRSSMASLADAATTAAMSDRRADFGRVRVWGSVGFVCFVLVSGSLKGSAQPALLVGMSSLILTLACASTLALEAPALRREKGIVSQVLGRLSAPSMLFFLLGNVFYYLGHAIYDVCFSLHLNGLGFSDRFVASAWATGSASEIAMMLLAPRLLKGAPSAVLLGVCASFSALRWGVISILRKGTLLLALQPLHAVTFGLWYLSVVQHIQKTAPEHLRTSTLSLAQATLGMGAVLGYLLGGWVFQRSSGAHAFQLAVAGSLAALICYALTAVLEHREG